MADVPQPEDHYIGESRRCEICKRGTPMFWIPDYYWQKYVPARLQRRHLCFGCFLVLARSAE